MKHATSRRSMRTALWALLAVVFFSVAARADITVTRINIGLPNTAVFLLDGGYDGNEILRFKRAIADVPPTVRIIAALNSPGGRLNQGFALGQFFHDAKIPTLILAGHECASSCSNAFFGGRDPVTGKALRILASGGRLGFHNFKSNGLPDRAYTREDLEKFSAEAQRAEFERLKYMRSVGAPLKALIPSLATPAADMQWLSEGDALALGITVLDRETGKLVSPENLISRTR